MHELLGYRETGNIDGIEGENQTSTAQSSHCYNSGPSNFRHRYQGIKPLQCQESLDAGVFR